MKIFLTILLGLTSSVFSQIPPEDLIVDIPDYGKMLGIQSTSEFTHKPYAQFLGIPYGIPPLGERRFKPALLLTNLNQSNLTPDLNGNYRMDYLGANCFQTGGFGMGSSEDCLFLNLFTPGIKKSDDQKLLPVIVFIHGGAYFFGSSMTYSGFKLLEHEIILISLNYRLASFGFLTFDTPEAPGNAALYDMVTALQWVQKYVEYYGGDPNQVTLTGQSAGAASVVHLMMSPLSRGLFSKAIADSGSAINEWAWEEDAIHAAKEIATNLNCVGDIRAVGKCMERVTALELDGATRDWIIKERLAGRLGLELTIPVIQKSASNTGYPPFLSGNPVKMMESGNYHSAGIPFMTGANRHDGSFILSLFYTAFIRPNGIENNPTFLREQLGPMFLNAMGVLPAPGVYDTILEYYMGDKKYSGNFTEMIPGLIDLGSVFFFKGATQETALLHSKTGGNVYLYSFDYKGSKTIYSLSGGVPEIPGGVAHADELMYLFPLTFGFNDQDKEMQREMTQIWANFATYGNPNGPDQIDSPWPRMNDMTKKYYMIDVEPSVHEDYSKAWQGMAKELVEEDEEETTTTTSTSTTTEKTDEVTASEGETEATTPDGNGKDGAHGMMPNKAIQGILVILFFFNILWSY